jgi:phospholipase D1/2
MESILEQEKNCWRIAHAGRAAFIIDGEDYFAAIRLAMIQARRSIFIVGWDLHSELRLVRNGESDEYPQTLGELLNALAAERPQLDIYVLNWDFAMIYAMEREFFPSYKLQWKSHDRVHFCLDGEHPVGASQHQKLVVVDDSVAFAGGLDLSKWRWDTRAHRVDDPRRTDPDGEHYPPFHDIQMVVDGEAAAALGELVRQRWSAAAGPAAPLRPCEGDAPWPATISPDVEDVAIAIARTLPAHGGRVEVREVERLYLDAIAAARRFIYIENQYLSSHTIGEALGRRLGEEDGPEIIIVMPKETGGWLEQHTMDVLRARLLRKLREADRHDRLRVYYVRLSRKPLIALMIHAKVMVVDDRFVRVASSNLSNRSMGLDSECDLAFEHGCDSDRSGVIAAFRQSLLAEHLGVEPAQVDAAEQHHESVIAAVESLRGGERTLEPLLGEISEEVDQLVPDSALIDPEQPIEPAQLLDYIFRPRRQKRAWHHFLHTGVLLAVVFGLAAMWHWTPLSQWLDIQRFADAARWIEESRVTPLLVIGAYIIGGILVFPVTLLIVATVTVFGPWLGAFYALLGAELSALTTFGLGHLLSRDAVRRFAGSQVNSLSRALSRRGALTIITLRIVPVAPFTVINVVAGVSAIRLRDFAIGSLVGMIPVVIAIAFLADRILASLREPTLPAIAVLVLSVAAVVLALVGLRHWIHKRRASAKASS